MHFSRRSYALAQAQSLRSWLGKNIASKSVFRTSVATSSGDKTTRLRVGNTAKNDVKAQGSKIHSGGSQMNSPRVQHPNTTLTHRALKGSKSKTRRLTAMRRGDIRTLLPDVVSPFYSSTFAPTSPSSIKSRQLSVGWTSGGEWKAPCWRRQYFASRY